jgi:hypothetical protein
VKEFEEFSHILLAIIITVGLIQQLQGFDEDFEAFLDYSSLHGLIAEELLENFD